VDVGLRIGVIALLRAIAEKLIPGIPEETRVSILQQTNNEEATAGSAVSPKKESASGRTVLEEVIDGATAKSELELEIKGKSMSETLVAIQAN
jgi:hypothetical protein